MKERNFKVILNNAIVDEINKAVKYYEGKQDSLGSRFFKATKTTLQTLEKDALFYQVKYKNVRCVKVKKFPYLVHYKIEHKSNIVRVYALICTHKNPDKNWVDRK